MNVYVDTQIARDIEIELRFTDKSVYNFKMRCDPHSNNRHVVVGRINGDVLQLIIKADDYWYDETLLARAVDDITIVLDGREKYTQMLRDAAMRSKPGMF